MPTNWYRATPKKGKRRRGKMRAICEGSNVLEAAASKATVYQLDVRRWCITADDAYNHHDANIRQHERSKIIEEEAMPPQFQAAMKMQRQVWFRILGGLHMAATILSLPV